MEQKSYNLYVTAQTQFDMVADMIKLEEPIVNAVSQAVVSPQYQ